MHNQREFTLTLTFISCRTEEKIVAIRMNCWEALLENARVRLVQGDITEMDTDAIVNAANTSLMGGGGVDGAIHRAGGPRIIEECKRIRAAQWPHGLPTGKAVMTTGGNLKARYVIHTPGPVWRGGTKGEAQLLKETYRNCLSLAANENIKTIAFPSISTGAYGYPIYQASRIAIGAVKEFIINKDKLNEIVFVLLTSHDFEIYRKMAQALLAV